MDTIQGLCGLCLSITTVGRWDLHFIYCSVERVWSETLHPIVHTRNWS